MLQEGFLSGLVIVCVTDIKPWLVTSAKLSADILVLGPNGFKELLELHFEFPFNLIGMSTVAFLTNQSWCILKSWYTQVGAQLREQRFWRCFTDRLNQSLQFHLFRLVNNNPFLTYTRNLQKELDINSIGIRGSPLAC